MKEDKYTKILALEKRFTQIYKALYENAILVSLSETPIWLPKTNRSICLDAADIAFIMSSSQAIVN